MAEDNRAASKEFVAFFLSEAPGLRRYFTQRLRTAEGSDDLVQEAWLRLARNADRAAAAPRPYLWRIASSLVYDTVRKRRRMPNTVPLIPGIDAEDPGASPEDLAVCQSEIAALRDALAELPKRRREIFVLVGIRGENRRSVASRYGVSRRTVDSELRMALDHCAERMKSRRPQ